MSGLITKQHIFEVARTYGVRVAMSLIFTKQKTFLGFLMSQGLV